MSEYEDHSLPENVYTDAKSRGFDFFADWHEEKEEEINWEERFQYPQVESDKMCEYVIWFLKQGDPELELTLKPPVEDLAFYGVDEKQRHIGLIGYGLFY